MWDNRPVTRQLVIGAIMWEMAWPLGLVVLSSVAYNVGSKLVPAEANPLVSIIVTYLVAAVFALVLYLLTGGRNVVAELGHLNWSSLVLSLAVVGIDVSVIYAYRVGWGVSQWPVVQSVLVAVAVMLVGFLVFKETITVRQVLGAAACLVGLVLITA